MENSENQSEIATYEQKTSEKTIFVQTPFSSSTLKLERNQSLFRSTSCATKI